MRGEAAYRPTGFGRELYRLRCRFDNKFDRTVLYATLANVSYIDILCIATKKFDVQKINCKLIVTIIKIMFSLS